MLGLKYYKLHGLFRKGHNQDGVFLKELAIEMPSFARADAKTPSLHRR
jgi:hypothetical protein